MGPPPEFDVTKEYGPFACEYWGKVVSGAAQRSWLVEGGDDARGSCGFLLMAIDDLTPTHHNPPQPTTTTTQRETNNSACRTATFAYMKASLRRSKSAMKRSANGLWRHSLSHPSTKETPTSFQPSRMATAAPFVSFHFLFLPFRSAHASISPSFIHRLHPRHSSPRAPRARTAAAPRRCPSGSGSPGCWPRCAASCLRRRTQTRAGPAAG